MLTEKWQIGPVLPFDCSFMVLHEIDDLLYIVGRCRGEAEVSLTRFDRHGNGYEVLQNPLGAHTITNALSETVPSELYGHLSC